MRTSRALPREAVAPLGRRAGFTLVEVVFAASLMIMTLGVVGAAFNTLVQGTTDLQQVLVAQNEAARIRLAMTNDLQLTDTLGVDGTGEPFFKIVDVDGGSANSIIFRTVTGFQSGGSGGVEMTYSSPIQYRVDDEGRMVRTQDGAETVLGTHVREVAFEKTTSGVILMKLVNVADPGDPTQDQHSHVQIAPRNSMQM